MQHSVVLNAKLAAHILLTFHLVFSSNEYTVFLKQVPMYKYKDA